ncbi:hypothetical protein P154DRAFT_137467 [Amniculicola lignicola CBS 123094]|uniref:Uncharacterized protein n=1 Tax=Amniculicola lignicola CBS 123094 TaxID=1392246 RepID=A0A6A5WYW8_9PLEO|nr:hypothetical protein P154DRAFT_137467 [Amniculicola lignicola CBS 123094]
MSTTNGTETVPPTSTPPSSTPVSLSTDTPSATPSPSPTPTPTPTSTPAESSTPPPSSTPAPSTPSDVTSVVTAPSATPSVEVVTSLVTDTPTAAGETPSVRVVTTVVTRNGTPPESTGITSATSSSATGTAPPALQNPNQQKSSGGLSTGGKTAIAVVVPVVVVAALVIAGILLWRRRKQRKIAEEARRKEVEEYGFNPNHDPTLPAVGMATEMAEDQSGYRGWGNTQTSSNRKASTTLASGMTYSDSNSNPGGYQSPNSPTTDAQSNDPLVNGRRETLDSEGIAALGAGPNASNNRSDIPHRGPSNASSSYSAANRSDDGDYPIPINNPQDYYPDTGYYQPGPYGEAYGASQQPVIRDVSARRNTRIENPTVFPQQGNSGIAQNF